ncbi:hypothetical protein DNTS_009610 [Danionella cerebrum]|uniref:Tumor necrosis factor n=1 Tax=Danionella cerebrum TaxID=2873325 RepID=A0A553R3I6_9TELE|nr:hypothetical protein DNTS_009610 [Danionella translucida]
MAKYETTVDLKPCLEGVYQTTVVPVPHKPSRSWIWKIAAVVTFLAVAAVLFSWHLMNPKQKEHKSFEEPHISPPSEHGRMLQQIAESTKAAIHLHGTRENQTLKWLSGVDHAFVQGGLQLVENKIKIPDNGLYFVYSQVSYATKCKLNKNEVEINDESQDNKYLSHSIWRKTDEVKDPIPLQNSAHSACQSPNEGETSYNTIYLGAVFKLMEDDELYTVTTNVEDVSGHTSQTFFGVFAL